MKQTVKTDYYGQQPIRRNGTGNHRAPTQTVRRKKRRKRLRYKIILWIRLYLGIAGITATCYVLFSLFFHGGDKVQAADTVKEDRRNAYASVSVLEEDELTGTSGFGTTVTRELREECLKLYAGQEDLLVLVNKDHELPADHQVKLRKICNGRLQAADVIYEDLTAMLKAAGKEGYEYWIASAHRTREYQQGLVDEDVERYMSKGCSYQEALEKTLVYTMPAGYSEHETGLALDILCSTNTMMDESQEGEPGNRWLREHCAEYGFILRYPSDKEDITKIGYEPWHFRYVGKEAAAFLSKNGWTLEEYYEVIG